MPKTPVMPEIIKISRAQLEMLREWFLPESPGPNVAAHLLQTGHGQAWVDQWPTVQAIITETNYNYSMVGNPNALDPRALAKIMAGFVAAPPSFLPLLEATFPTLVKWPRIIGWLPDAPTQPPPVHAELRRLQAEDAEALDNLSAESIWVSQTWGGGEALAHSGFGWGAWVDGMLVSVACTFFLGNEHEDIGIITESPYRGQGLSSACTYELCLDIIARGRKPTWATSTDNIASWRVAERVGFVRLREDWLYVVGRDLPGEE